MLLPKQLLVFVLLINVVVGLVAANHVVAGLGADGHVGVGLVAANHVVVGLGADGHVVLGLVVANHVVAGLVLLVMWM